MPQSEYVKEKSTLLPRLALTPGEPAGVGPELMGALLKSSFNAHLVVIADRELLRERIACWTGDEKAASSLKDYDPDTAGSPGISVLHVPLKVAARPGILDEANAPYVLACLERACDGCLQGEFSGIVTGPVSKAVLDTPEHPFSGHTEFFQERSRVARVVMLLGCKLMKVALCTTHLPLKEVSAALSGDLIEEVVSILFHDLQRRFGVQEPRIMMAGLNPHAGENGHLGREELEIIIPALNRLKARGITVQGPLPADTMFLPENLSRTDAFLCLYHDQGLPVLKFAGFKDGYNTTLGLPFVRTSVDHGTALDLAGKGSAAAGSLISAVRLACSQVSFERAFRQTNRRDGGSGR